MAHKTVRNRNWREVVDGLPSFSAHTELRIDGHNEKAWFQLCSLGIRSVLLLADRYLARRTAADLTKAFMQTNRGDDTNANRQRFWELYQELLEKVNRQNS